MKNISGRSVHKRGELCLASVRMEFFLKFTRGSAVKPVFTGKIFSSVNYSSKKALEESVVIEVFSPVKEEYSY